MKKKTLNHHLMGD